VLYIELKIMLALTQNQRLDCTNSIRTIDLVFLLNCTAKALSPFYGRINPFNRL